MSIKGKIIEFALAKVLIYTYIVVLAAVCYYFVSAKYALHQNVRLNTVTGSVEELREKKGEPGKVHWVDITKGK